MADVEDGVALGGTDFELVVDLCHERADGIDHHSSATAGRHHHLRRRTVGREHEGCALRHLVHIVHEDDSLSGELLHHVPVVDDLVVAVDGRLEDPHHPGQGLDGLLDAGAEAAGLGQQHSIDGHRARLPAQLLALPAAGDGEGGR